MNPLPRPSPDSVPERFHAELSRLLDDFEAACRDLSPRPAHWPEELPAVWVCSEFAARLCIRHPQRLVELMEDGLLERALEPGEMAARVREVVEQAADDAGL